MPKAEGLAEDVTPAQRRADALGLLAETALTSDLDRGSAGDRYQVVLHVDTPIGVAAGKGLAVAAGDGLSGALEVDHGVVDVSAETSRRLVCDASMVLMRHGADGAVLDVGRKTRTVPPTIRRALQARDHTCRFPGCTARRCDAHHVEHWDDIPVWDGTPFNVADVIDVLYEPHVQSARAGSAARAVFGTA